VELSVRPATSWVDDRPLRTFRCSSHGRPYEDEVEVYIQEGALNTALSGRLDHRLLLIEAPEDGLVAVVAHHSKEYPHPDDQSISGTHLVVIAVELRFQGTVLTDDRGARLSDFVMDAMLADADARGRGSVVTALVAAANSRALALCERAGLVERLPSSQRGYELLVGWRNA
jgi:hypothetical protein